VKQNANLFYILFCIVSLSSANNLWAQDSIRKHPLTYISAGGVDRNTEQQILDTNMNETEIFHPMYKKNVLFQDLGNIGTEGRRAIFSVNQPVGFNGVFNPYSNYLFTPQNARFYNTTKPFTELFYTQGSQE
jgi:hypothetical protein